MSSTVESTPQQVTPLGPHGLGGWLILPALGLILSVVSQLGAIAETFDILSSDTWGLLTTKGSEVYHPLWAPLIIYELVVNVALVAFEIVLMVLFQKRRRGFPGLMIIWLSALFLTTLVDQVASNLIPFVAQQPADPENMRVLFRSAVGCAIWIPYFLRSKRVKNTFVTLGGGTN